MFNLSCDQDVMEIEWLEPEPHDRLRSSINEAVSWSRAGAQCSLSVDGAGTIYQHTVTGPKEHKKEGNSCASIIDDKGTQAGWSTRSQTLMASHVTFVAGIVNDLYRALEVFLFSLCNETQYIISYA